MNNSIHYLAAITAFVMWGFFSLPLRALKEFSPGEILYFRILFSLIILCLIIFSVKKKDMKADLIHFKSLPKIERNKVLSLTLLGGALLCVNWLTFIYIVNFINVKTASFSYLICPVITAVLGVVLIKEKMSTIQWVSVGLCGVSCVLIGMNSALELGYSFLTAFTYALYLITQRRNQGFDRMVILGIQILFSFVILNLVFNQLVAQVPTSLKFYSLILLIAVCFTVIPLFLNLFALNKINSATIGILMYINPLFNFTLALLVFDEGISFLQSIGYVIILMALVLFNYQNVKKLRGAVA